MLSNVSMGSAGLVKLDVSAVVTVEFASSIIEFGS